jgi:hypothetical protein
MIGQMGIKINDPGVECEMKTIKVTSCNKRQIKRLFKLNDRIEYCPIYNKDCQICGYEFYFDDKDPIRKFLEKIMGKKQ